MRTLKTLFILVILAVTGCFSEPKKLSQMEEYDGPVLESENALVTMTEAGMLKLVIQGKEQLTFGNGDLSFPNTIRIDFFDPNGDTTSVLTAMEGTFDAETQLYRAFGDVVVTNLKEKQTLKTEELFWNPETEKIFTEKFFIVTTEKDLIQGTGLEAPQDFSSYSVTNPGGSIIEINESDENNK